MTDWLPSLPPILPKKNTPGYLKGEMYYDLMHTEPWPLFGMNYRQAWNWVSDLVIDPKGDCRSASLGFESFGRVFEGGIGPGASC